jgi:hypothetical protein
MSPSSTYRRVPRALRPLLALATSVVLAVSLAPPASAAPLDRYNSVADPMSTFELQFLDNFVPQGIAYSESRNRFFVTHYNWRDGGVDSRIAIHAGDGRYLRYVRIAPGHVGGITVWRDWLYVVTDGDGGMGRLRRYSLNRVLNADKGDYVKVLGVRDTYQGASAFVTVHAGTIYFGTHTSDSSWDSHGKMWSWALDPDNGAPRPVRTDATPTSIPPNVQGMVRTGKYEIYSQSWRRDCHSRFTVVNRDNGNRKRIYGPSMSEGIVNAGGSLFIAYESGAKKYRDGDGNGSSLNPVYRAHYANLKDFATTVLQHGWNPGNDPGCTG